MTDFYARVVTGPEPVWTVPQGDRNYNDSLSWSTGRDPSDESKNAACRAAFGPESVYSGANWKGSGAFDNWRPVCRWSGARTGNVDGCCDALGTSSNSGIASCPVGSNNPVSEVRSGYWTRKCNSDPAAMVNSNICRTLYEQAQDKAKLRPFVKARCYGATSRPGDKFCLAAMADPAFRGETTALCNSAAGFASNKTFCRKWCIDNDGQCDATMTAYCDSDAGRADPICGCYGSNAAYDDPKFQPLRDAGMVRCAAPCTSGDVYVPASAAGITTCCSQISTLNIDQGRTFVASAAADVNLSMQCGDSIRELKKKINDADNNAIDNNTVSSPTSGADDSTVDRRKIVLYFIIFMIVSLFTGSVVAVIVYFRSSNKAVGRY